MQATKHNKNKLFPESRKSKKQRGGQFKAEGGGGGGEFLQFRQAELLLKECQLWGPQLTCALI